MGIESHLRCSQVVEIASDYLDRALSSGDAERLEQHLLICAGCAEYVEQMRGVLSASARLVVEPDEPLDEATQERMRALLRGWKERGKP